MSGPATETALELWGGVECTVNRVGDAFRDQVALTGHDARRDDLQRFAELGLRTLRFPVLWERTAPDGPERARWEWSDERLGRLRGLGITPIVGLVHHGSGPAFTHLLDPEFPERLAEYASAVAERYPWVRDFTPVNEPLTTARFSALYGHWYPHLRDEQAFLRAVLHQCRATVLALRAIREFVPAARLIQTEDLGQTYSTRLLSYQADFDNDRRWLSLDLLTGRLRPADRMWRHMVACGIPEWELEWFRENPCPPAVFGINHYVTTNRWLDTRLDLYPEDTWGGNGRHRYADVAAVRAVARPAGPAELLEQAWKRYRIPLAITEAHMGCTREEQLRWLLEAWQAGHAARSRGADVRAVTVWALLGTYDWDSLLTREAGHYEPGAFDVRGPEPRLTALGRLTRDLAQGRAPDALARAPGWWRRGIRFEYRRGRTRSSPLSRASAGENQPTILVLGGGTLGTAIGRLAEIRGLQAHLLRRADCDVADPASVKTALEVHRPWAVVNAAGYVRVADAEREPERCFRENADGAEVLARACAERDVRLVTFSSDLVFSGEGRRPYVESDAVAPQGVYGASKAEAERRVAAVLPAALIVRTSAFFGPWDGYNLLTLALGALRSGEEYAVPAATVSPTYVPDLVNAALDLLIDGERGIWHLANTGEASWLELVRRGAALVGLSAERVREAPPEPWSGRGYTALDSERGRLLPSLDDALGRYARHFRDQPARAVLPAVGA